MFTAAAASCPSGDTLAQLETLGSCQIGDKIFSDFTYTDSVKGGALPVTAVILLWIRVGAGQDVRGVLTMEWSLTVPGLRITAKRAMATSASK